MIHRLIAHTTNRLACVLLLLTSFAAPAFGQRAGAQSAAIDWHFRYELFQSVLEEQNLRPVRNLLSVYQNPSESVIVSLGKFDKLSDVKVQQFCSNGGAVLIARDSESFLGQMCSFRPGAVSTDSPSDAYQDHPDCILLTDINQKHRLMRGIGSLVVNKAGWLASPRWSTYRISKAAGYDGETNPAASQFAPVVATIDAFQRSGGELIVCSDQSLFTNGMLWHADNSLFAINVAEVLAGNSRKYVHFLADGQSLSSYQDSPLLNPPNNMQPPPLDQLPEMDFETKLKLWNTIAREVANSNVVNEFLADRPRNVLPPYYRRGVLFGLGIVALLLMFWFLLSRFASASEAMPVRSMQTAYAIRSDRKIQGNNFGYAASMLARDFCRELTESGDRAVWLRTLRPKLSSNATVVQQPALQSPLNRIVDLAVNSQKVNLSTRDFSSLGEDINTLRHLHRDGKLLIMSEDSSPH